MSSRFLNLRQDSNSSAQHSVSSPNSLRELVAQVISLGSPSSPAPNLLGAEDGKLENNIPQDLQEEVERAIYQQAGMMTNDDKSLLTPSFLPIRLSKEYFQLGDLVSIFNEDTFGFVSTDG